MLVRYGELPLLTPRPRTELSSRDDDSGAVLTFLSAYLDDPTGYGRILREDGQVGGIVEESETDERTRRIHEVNAGLYATEARWLWPTLEGIKPGPRGEIYLTDIIGAAVASTERLQAYQITESSEVQQVNTRTELALAERAMRERIRARLMADGVTVTDPDTWTAPWTAEIPMRRNDLTLFEYACHEGNHSMEGILAGARAEEQAAAYDARQGSR